MTCDCLIDGADNAVTVLLAHGAGAAMDSAWMDTAAKALATAGLRVVRFEFAYMAARRHGHRKPPPRAERLVPEYFAAVERLGDAAPLIIAGKSMGGRVASIVADELHAAGTIAGLVCLGYPFHPPGRPERLRTSHLAAMATPTLIFQGTRDAFGTRQEVANYELSEQIEVVWLEDADHDLRPRKTSGFTPADHLRTVATAVRTWAARIGVTASLP